MIKELKRTGLVVEEKFPGIFYVTGNNLFATQIVVTGRLRQEGHSSLRVLSKQVQEEDIRRFLMESEMLETPGDRNNMDAVLQVSISANESMYEKIKEDMKMCEALEKLMQKEISEKVAAGTARAKAEGKAEGKQDALLASIRNLTSSMKISAEQAMDALGIPLDEQAFYIAKLGR
jgi:myosin heavy subunit